MAREKKPVHKVRMTDGKRNIIQQLLQEYDIQSAEDIQDALKDLLGGTIKEMMSVSHAFPRKNATRQLVRGAQRQLISIHALPHKNAAIIQL